MEKVELEGVLSDWSYWDGSFPDSWHRDTDLPKTLSPDIVWVLQGVRRCGKSTLLTQIVRRLKLPADACFFINFEDPRLSRQLNAGLLDQLLAIGTARKPNDERYFFFDEIQHVDDWEKWLRSKVDHAASGQATKNHFVITGSNGSLLSGELASSLTGRQLSFEVFPLSFFEYRTQFPGASIEDYIVKGGFPRPLQDQQPQRLLQQYFLDITERDLRERLKARSSRKVQQLIRAVYESLGAESSLRRLAGIAGVTVDTVSSYLEKAEEAYILFSVPHFGYSEAKRTHRNKKYYPIDTSLRRAVVSRTGLDYGKDFEALVFLELRRRYRDIYYWKGRHEVDFIVQSEQGLVPYQVSWNAPQERHHKAIEEFYHQYRSASDPIYITPDNFDAHFGNALAQRRS